MKIARGVASFFITQVIYLGLPLLGWGVDDLAEFFAKPQLIGYAISIAAFGILAYLTVQHPGGLGSRGKGQQDKIVKRLFDRSGWSQRQQVFTIASKLCALLCLPLIILSPLKIGSPVFYIGATHGILGLIGLVKALFDFKNTPDHQPVAGGLYRISRHPQIMMSTVVLLGACIAIGSWLALILLALARFLGHWSILAEEEICLKQYGDSYRDYLQHTPRYFIFFLAGRT